MIVTISIIAFIVILIVVALIVTVGRVSSQRVSLHDGNLVTSVMGEREASIPTSDIGVLLYIPENDGGDARYKMGVFDYGGIIILNKAHKLIRVIRHYAGSTLALEPIYEQIPADQKIPFESKKRADLLQLFPKSVGFFQLRGETFWVMVPVLGFVIAIIAVCLIAFVVFATLAFVV